jgi:hypothetical protein
VQEYLRLNSLLLIASGMSGGLAACLILRFCWAAMASQSRATVWRHSGAMNELLYVSSHAAIGAGVGFLFWLSWGFTALAGLTWWQQGLSFGLLNALVFGALPLVVVRSVLRFETALYGVLLSELVLTCTLASLATSWSWQKAF